MKQLYLIIFSILVLSLFLVSCASQQTLEPEKEAAEEKDTVELPGTAAAGDKDAGEVTEVQEEQEDETDSLEGLPADLVILMSKGNEKAKNVYFLYRGMPMKFREACQYYRLGDKLKIVKPEEQVFDRTTYYDTAYVDLKTGDIVGYCEDEKKCYDMITEFDAKFEDFVGVLPEEWYDHIDSAVKVGTEEIFNRDANIYEFEYEGKTSKIWIDPFYGLPLQVYIDSDSAEPEIYHYEIKSVGTVKTTDIEHQAPSR